MLMRKLANIIFSAIYGKWNIKEASVGQRFQNLTIYNKALAINRQTGTT